MFGNLNIILANLVTVQMTPASLEIPREQFRNSSLVD